MSIFKTEQYVCKVCGFNIIGHHPQNCPFCGASQDNFITAEECFQDYKIVKTKVSENVFRLNSFPSLGLEHSAYCIKANSQVIWIDCPSTFSENIERMDKILFTHHHFLGASNIYRGYFTSFVWIHQNDSENSLANRHSFDKRFFDDFNLSGIEAYHINGHTKGFTIYIFENILFICDYVFVSGDLMRFNPYGNTQNTKLGGLKLSKIIESKDLVKVCGYNYLIDYSDWKKKWDMLINSR